MIQNSLLTSSASLCVALLDAINFIRLRAVQLAQLMDNLEICALVQCAAQASLPQSGVVFVLSFPVFALVQGPGLSTQTFICM